MIVERLERNFPRYSVSPAVVFQRYGEVSPVITLPKGWPGWRPRFEGSTGLRWGHHRVPLQGRDGEGRDQALVVPVVRREFSLKIFQSTWEARLQALSRQQTVSQSRLHLIWKKSQVWAESYPVLPRSEDARRHIKMTEKGPKKKTKKGLLPTELLAHWSDWQ